MIYLHKLLPLMASPLGLVFFLIITGIYFRRWWIIILSCLVLILSSLPMTAQFIWKNLEKDYPPKALSEFSSYDAVVVLSGMLSPFEHNGKLQVEWGDPDRFFAGINILKAGKASTLIFTRGKMPWSSLPAEGELLRAKAIELGINESQILLSNIVANTEEEAEAVVQLMSDYGLKTIILITSSFHMPRAMQLFNKAGINVEAYSTDFRVSGTSVDWLDYLPSADGFRDTSNGILEYIGRVYYQLKL